MDASLCLSHVLTIDAPSQQEVEGHKQVLLEKPPVSDETSAQLARRLRATVKAGEDMTEYRDLIVVRPSSLPTHAQ